MVLYLCCACVQIRAQQVIALDTLEERLWHIVNEYQLTSPRLHPHFTALCDATHALNLPPGVLHGYFACLQIPVQQVIASNIDALEERVWHDVNKHQLTWFKLLLHFTPLTTTGAAFVLCLPADPGAPGHRVGHRCA
jgi:hypothetical protein